MRPVVRGVDGAGLVLHGHAEPGRAVAAPGRLRAVVVKTLLDVVGRMPLVKPMLLLLLQVGMELMVLMTVLKGCGGNCHWIDQLVLLVLLLLMLLLLMWTATARRVVIWLVEESLRKRIVLDLESCHILILEFKISLSIG